MVRSHWRTGGKGKGVSQNKKVQEDKKERGKRETWLSSERQNCNITHDRKRMKAPQINTYSGIRNTLSV